MPKLYEKNHIDFDSKCSRHMIGDKAFVRNLKVEDNGHVTFGDGAKGRILEKGTLNVDGLPKLTELL